MREHVLARAGRGGGWLAVPALALCAGGSAASFGRLRRHSPASVAAAAWRTLTRPHHDPHGATTERALPYVMAWLLLSLSSLLAANVKVRQYLVPLGSTHLTTVDGQPELPIGISG